MSGQRAQRIATVRRFNRFYTQCVGELDNGFRGNFSLTEVRVLLALADGEATTATVLNRQLGLDPGYLSRILYRFDCAGLLRREIGRQDRRELELSLTQAGQAVVAPLEHAASAEVARLLQPLSEQKQRELLAAMQAIMQLLGEVALKGR